MNVKFKLVLPTLAGLMLSILIIQFFWLPLQLKNAKSVFEKHTHELLSLGSTGIILHLLEHDLGSLFSVIEQLEKTQKNRWLNITLYNDNKKQLYPINRDNPDTTAQDKNLIHIVYPLTIEGTNIGLLELDADWGHEKIIVIENINVIRDTIIGIIILAILITAISQYYIIYRPLKKLESATHKIRDNDFNTELPHFTQDEIGDLAKSFSMMQEEIAFQKNALDHHAIVSAADKNGMITDVNDKFLSISGYRREELIGKTHRVVRSNTHPLEFYKDMWGTISRGAIWHGDICNMNKTGEKYWVSSTIVPFLDDQGIPVRYISIRTDITKQKKVEEQLRHMANHDTLTGLPTRRLGKENLSIALAHARRDNSMAAVLFIDLDGFKQVNDSLGHDAGDQLLVGVAERITRNVREVDMVVRVGGDEFLVILSGVNRREDVALLSQKLIDALALPFTLYDKTATIGASIGIALYPDDEQEPESLIKCADKMMYAVKRKGKNNFAFYDEI
jgi:diguanylate cyclase (GGDEF)-like protein/PAS domain S-box-containing protein